MSNSKGRVVLCTGSREFQSLALVKGELDRLERPTIVMHGGAKGADRLVSQAIQGEFNPDRPRNQKPDGLDDLVEVRVPYLSMAGNKGGHLRNSKMLEMLEAFRDAGYECWGIAFHFDIHNPSPGTNGMVKLLNHADFAVVHVDERTNMVM